MKHFMVRMNQEDLKGDPNLPCDCPITRAIKRRFPDANYVSCGFDSVSIQWLDNPAGHRWHTYRVSKSAQQFQRDRFDGIDREPLTFVIREDQDAWSAV